MRITIIALGSMGDVLPMITLGQALARRGHQVQVGTFKNFAAQVAECNLDFLAIRGDARILLNSEAGLGIAQAGQNTFRMAASILRTFGPLAEGYAQDLAPLASQGTDLIVNQLPGGLFGWALEEKIGARQILASVIPLAPTRTQPMLAFPRTLAGIPGYNWSTHWLAYQIVWQSFRPVINRWRINRLGLSPAPFRGYFRKTCAGTPVLAGISPHVVPRPVDWDDNIRLTGYWFPEREEWVPDPALQKFLDSGPPPVFLGFGSMPIADKAATVNILLEALQIAGLRGVLQAGWSDLPTDNLPPEVVKIDFVPYGWLFPQMAAVVHHGGSGTTAFGLRAGIPELVVPFTFDQFYWGARIYTLGVGPRPIPFRRLTAKNLASAFGQMVGGAEMRARADELGRVIRAENGVAAAVEAIEGIALQNG